MVQDLPANSALCQVLLHYNTAYGPQMLRSAERTACDGLLREIKAANLQDLSFACHVPVAVVLQEVVVELHSRARSGGTSKKR